MSIRHGPITIRKEVTNYDSVDHRSVPVERYRGPVVYSAIRGSRVGNATRERRKCDGERKWSDESRMGYLYSTGPRQEEEFMLNNRRRFGSITATSTFASLRRPKVVST
jgi:hypothetical protein